MFRLLLLLCCGLLLVRPAAAQRVDVPLGAAPAGFAWQPLPAIRAAMLLPAGWSYRAEGPKGAPTYYLTQQELGESSEFQTGCSLQVVRKAQARTGRLAPEYAELLLLRTGFGPAQQLLEKTAGAAGPFYRRAVRYREAPLEAEARIVYQLALANARTDTLYLLTFESAERDWPAARKLGEVMVRELVLDGRL